MASLLGVQASRKTNEDKNWLHKQMKSLKQHYVIRSSLAINPQKYNRIYKNESLLPIANFQHTNKSHQ